MVVFRGETSLFVDVCLKGQTGKNLSLGGGSSSTQVRKVTSESQWWLCLKRFGDRIIGLRGLTDSERPQKKKKKKKKK